MRNSNLVEPTIPQSRRDHCYRELQTKKRELQNAAKKFSAVSSGRRGDVAGAAIELEDAAHALVRAEKAFVETDRALQAFLSDNVKQEAV